MGYQNEREILKRLGRIEVLLNRVLTKETTNMATLQDLQAQVAAVASTEDSAVALITGLIAKIQALIDSGGSPDQFQALVDDLKAHTEPLAAAVAANNP